MRPNVNTWVPISEEGRQEVQSQRSEDDALLDLEMEDEASSQGM